MEKIKMTTPLVEMDGDEMTRILWQQIKDELLLPYIDLKTEYYDLGLPEREKTGDQVTVDAAEATKKYGVAVKCATITPNAQRVEEYKLSEMWKSPNGTIRAILDGTVFRAPIMVKGISPVVKNWKKPITIARHAYGDVYKATEYRVPGPGKAELVFTGADGRRLPPDRLRLRVRRRAPGPVQQGQLHLLLCPLLLPVRHRHQAGPVVRHQGHHLQEVRPHLQGHLPGDLRRGVQGQSSRSWASTYFYTLIDDAVARVIRSEGGFIWACKNYDGDVMSDMVSTAFGSLAMMTSVLVSPDGKYEYEAAHGTVTRHYYKLPEGGGDLHQPHGHPLRLDRRPAQAGRAGRHRRPVAFADKLEAATIATIEGGTMTSDLVGLWEGETPARGVTSLEFLRAIKANLEKSL